MVFFSGGDVFWELWSDIPECESRYDYCSLLNYIEDCFGDREITAFDRDVLVSCLEMFAQKKGWEPL